MSAYSDDQLAQVRAQSDAAFAEMQREADRRHAEFIRAFGSDVVPQLSGPAPTHSAPAPSAPVAPKSVPQPVPAQAAPAPAMAPPTPVPGLDSAEKLFETAPTLNLGEMSKEGFADSVEDLKSDFDVLQKNLREESRAAARAAVRGTGDIIKGSASGLGKKAKEEAARLKDAMKQAMAEEKSLKAMKGRAADELRKAKERFQDHVEDAKDDAMGDMQQFAQGQFESLRGKASGVLQEGQESISREWNDFSTGKDS